MAAGAHRAARSEADPLGSISLSAAFSTINPTTGKVITSFSAGGKKDVDLAVAAAEEAYTERWGEKVAGHARGVILHKLAALIDEHADELAALESLDNGKAYSIARAFDVSEAAACLRYYAGWADKDGGKVIEVDDSKFACVPLSLLDHVRLVTRD
jgi:aldehyde dehydrogenase (NAD+)